MLMETKKQAQIADVLSAAENRTLAFFIRRIWKKKSWANGKVAIMASMVHTACNKENIVIRYLSFKK